MIFNLRFLLRTWNKFKSLLIIRANFGSRISLVEKTLLALVDITPKKAFLFVEKDLQLISFILDEISNKEGKISSTIANWLIIWKVEHFSQFLEIRKTFLVTLKAEIR